MEFTVQTDKQQSQPTVSNRLRDEAARNPVFSAVAHAFALRQRARQQITMARLKVAMASEGYEFTRVQLEQVLKFLASQNLGTLDYGPKGRVRALKNIKVTLQSIGLAAVAGKQSFERLRVPSKFIKLPETKEVSTADVFATPAPPPTHKVPPFTPADKHKSRQYQAAMTVTVDGEEIRFDIPKKVTMEQFFKILAGLYELA